MKKIDIITKKFNRREIREREKRVRNNKQKLNILHL